MVLHSNDGTGKASSFPACLSLHITPSLHAGEVEYRNLAEKELALCTRAAVPPGLKLKDADMDMVEALHKKGILYLEVPIRPDDHVAIPPLEVWPPRMLRTVHRRLRPSIGGRCQNAAVLIGRSSS